MDYVSRTLMNTDLETMNDTLIRQDNFQCTFHIVDYLGFTVPDGDCQVFKKIDKKGKKEKILQYFPCVVN